jgi:plastocyanin
MNWNSLTRRQVLVRGATVALTGSIAGCVGGSGSNESTVTMTEDLRFDPETITVSPETTVVWENPSEANHTVTAIETSIPEGASYFASGGFDSEQAARNDSNEGLVEPGGTYSHTFSVTGSYDYVCLPHEQSGMVGTVTVTDGES